MASTLTLTPDLTSAVAQELNDRNPFYVSVDGLALPVVSYDEAYAESIYSEGGRRSRSRAQNPEGKVNLLVTSGLSASTLRTRLGELQQTVEACRVYGGTLAYTPEDGVTVTYDLESISLSSFDTSQLQFGRAPLELSVTTRPYGRLAPVVLKTNETSADPMQLVELPDIPGSAPALVELNVTDEASQARDHLEAGIDTDYQALRTNLVTNPSFETNATGWSTSVPAYHLNSGTTLTRVTPSKYQAGLLVGNLATPGSNPGEGIAFAFSGYMFLGAGSKYTLSMRVRAATDTNCNLVLGYASTDHAKTDFTATSEWQTVSVTWTVGTPTTGGYAIIRTDLGGAAVARTIQVDSVLVERADTAQPYFDGSLGGIWIGTAHASLSWYGKLTLYDSAFLSTDGLAGSATTRTGAYSSSGVIRATLGPDPLGICEKTLLPHRRKYRAKLRVYATGTGPVYVRVAYRVASDAWTYNAWRQVRGLNAFYEIDCGLVKGSDAGTLSVRVEARSALATFADTIDVDYLILMPASRWAKVKGRADTTVVTYGARDQFNQSAGYLDAPKTADVGGNWAEANRTGANGFEVETTGHTAQRAIPSDSSIYDGGCYAYVGSAVAACRVEGTVRMSAQPTGQTLRTHAYGLLARYTDANSWAAWVLCDGSAPGLTDVYPERSIYGHQLALLAKTSAGSVVTVAQTDLSAYYGVTGYNYSMAVEIDANGAYRCYWQGMLVLSGSYGEFVTGGALDDGKVGIFDVQTTSASITRNYDNFRSSGLSAATDYQHVVDADGAVIIDHESVRRSDGTRPPEFEGSYLTVPPAGREDRTHLLAVKMRRNDVDVTTDDNIADNQRLDVTVTPRVVLL